eukprot:1189360-Prorocentrum_minimum.AAC.2
MAGARYISVTSVSPDSAASGWLRRRSWCALHQCYISVTMCHLIALPQAGCGGDHGVRYISVTMCHLIALPQAGCGGDH